MKIRFKKHQNLQNLYEHYLNNPPIKETERGPARWHGSSTRQWFWLGYDGSKMPVRNSWCHAAWAAGQDWQKAGNEAPTLTTLNIGGVNV